jgi:ribosome biogenesis protein Tsr3
MIDFVDMAAINSLVLLWGAYNLLSREDELLSEPALVGGAKAPNNQAKKQIHRIEFRCEDRRMAEQFAANLVLYGYQSNLRSSVTGSLWLVSLHKTNQVDKDYVKAIKPFMTTLAKNSKGTFTHTLESI